MQMGEKRGAVRRLGAWIGTASLVLGMMTTGLTAAASSASAAGSSFKACVVTDTGGINDKSFNESAYNGLLDAARLNPNIVPSYLSSTSSTDYAPNIQSFVSQGCGIIVTVGFLMQQDTQTAATANPNQLFAIVDSNVTGSNVLSLNYMTNQGAFLGG